MPAGPPPLTAPDSGVVTAGAAPATDAPSPASPTPTAPVVAPSTQNPPPPVTSATPAAPVAPPVLVAQPAHVAAQLSPRLVALAGRSAGTHRLTLEVKPEAIGSVTVVAHIRPEGTRIELVGASPAARDALQASLDDLRKDLAATGSGASLDVSLGSGAASRQGQDRAPHSWFSARSAGRVDDGERVVDLAPARLKVGPGRVDVLA
ncbi:flagellar hook-length control protein FliK [Quadrisphaera sp. KR29]|uniref:flagellar hook-length control protein FliK n=1 Tax=Quadrisphaera sp. KR29 TaxID=3461391 RepID=UPI004044040E